MAAFGIILSSKKRMAVIAGVLAIVDLHFIDFRGNVSWYSCQVCYRTNNRGRPLCTCRLCRTSAYIAQTTKLVPLDSGQLGIFLFWIVKHSHWACSKFLVSWGCTTVSQFVKSPGTAILVSPMPTATSCTATTTTNGGPIPQTGGGILEGTLVGIICKVCLDGIEVQHHIVLGITYALQG